jgi:hypothetical protein
MPRLFCKSLCLALAVIIFGDVARAENGDLQFLLSSDPQELKDPSANLDLRPNVSRTVYLFLRNTSNDVRDVTVQVLSADRRSIWAEGQVMKVPRSTAEKPIAVRVTLAKPPMPKASPEQGASSPMPPMPMMPPMPPGHELAATPNADMTRQDFVFRIRAFDDRKPKERGEPSEEVPVVVGIRQPTDYVKPQKITYRKQGKSSLLTVTMQSDETFVGSEPCPVELYFPPQPTINVGALREGVFRRPITGPNQTARLYAKDLPLRGEGELGTFSIHVDGVPRAYVFRHALLAETTGEADITQLSPPAIRFAEAATAELPQIQTVEENRRQQVQGLYTRPRVVPLRVEVDSTSGQVRVVLRIRQLPGNEVVETITRDAPRERRVWLDAGADGGFLVTTRVNDWVIPLDVRDWRGRFNLQAVLTGANGQTLASFDRTLVVDETKPESVRLEVLPGRDPKEPTPRHVRTKPLPVRVAASDPESGISRVVVFFGKVGPDGKLPEPVIEAKFNETEGAWMADVPIPPTAAAPMPPAPATPMLPPAPKMVDVTAIAVNGVGLVSEPASLRIQLLDPPTGGTIKGIVAMSQSGKGLPGVKVQLISSEDGKPKGSATTNAKGEFVFEDVPAGGYRLVSSRPDSGVGTKGEETVRVMAGKTSEVRVILTRRP